MKQTFMCQFYNWIEDGAMVIYKDVETGAAVVLLESWVQAGNLEPSKQVFLNPARTVAFPRHVQITIRTEPKDFDTPNRPIPPQPEPDEQAS